MNKWILFFFLIIGLACGWAGFLMGKSNSEQSQKDYLIKAIRSSQNGLINPLLEYELGSELYNKTLKLFREDVDKVVEQNIHEGKAEDIAVYFRSLNNGPWFGVRENEAFFPASLLKVPLMMAYYKWAEVDPKILQKEVKYDEDTFKTLGDFNNLQYFKTKNPIEVGKTYTVQDLIERMIVNSDNNAKNLLIINLDSPERLFKVYTDLGLATPPELRGLGDVLSVHEYSTFFRILYNASYLSKDMSKKALELLTKTNFKQGLVAKLPQDTKVAHKFGEYEDEKKQFKQLHDCGIVYYPSYPYLICFMTRGRDFETLEKVIQNLSLAVYQEIDKQIKRDKE